MGTNTEPDKPCPFCGSTFLAPYGSAADPVDDTERWIQCEDCGAHGPWATIGCRDEDDEIDLDAEAVELWNKRRKSRGPRLVAKNQ